MSYLDSASLGETVRLYSAVSTQGGTLKLLKVGCNIRPPGGPPECRRLSRSATLRSPMHAFDFILVLFSFVNAAAITHLLSTAGEIIIAAKRIRLSWFNAGWMLVGLLFACAWWIGLWDLHAVGFTGHRFGSRSISPWRRGFILYARMVSPRIPEKATVICRHFTSKRGEITSSPMRFSPGSRW